MSEYLGNQAVRLIALNQRSSLLQSYWMPEGVSVTAIARLPYLTLQLPRSFPPHPAWHSMEVGWRRGGGVGAFLLRCTDSTDVDSRPHLYRTYLVYMIIQQTEQQLAVLTASYFIFMTYILGQISSSTTREIREIREIFLFFHFFIVIRVTAL